MTDTTTTEHETMKTDNVKSENKYLKIIKELERRDSAKDGETTFRGEDKIARYKWNLVDRPGVFLEIEKADLLIDDAYQRHIKDPKVMEFAGDWSWIACGVIKVADRSGLFFVIDGQHRVMAARKRSDIAMLPCLVFESAGLVSEAQGFLDSNTSNRPLSVLDRFKALLITNDPRALMVERLFSETGRRAGKGSYDGVYCIASLLDAAKKYPKELERVWPLIDEICKEQVVSQSIVLAVMHIECRMNDGESLTDRRWKSRLLSIGYDTIHESMNKAAAYYGSRTPTSFSVGLLDALNKGLRNHLVMKGINSQ